MAQQHLKTGSNDSDGTGDTLRGAFIKTEVNFNDLYNIASSYPFPYAGEVEIDGDLSTTLGIESPTLTASILNPTDDSLPNYQYTSITNPEGVRFYMRNEKTLTFITDTGRLNMNNYGSSFLTSNRFYIGPTSGIFQIRGTTTSNLVYTSNTSLNVGISTNLTTHKLTVNGAISSSEYLGTLPTSDPNVIGQWFTTSSNEVFGDGLETQIICISQG